MPGFRWSTGPGRQAGGQSRGHPRRDDAQQPPRPDCTAGRQWPLGAPWSSATSGAGACENPRCTTDMDKFWRQTLRWLIADVPGGSRSRRSNDPTRRTSPSLLQVRVRDRGLRADGQRLASRWRCSNSGRRCAASDRGARPQRERTVRRSTYVPRQRRLLRPRHGSGRPGQRRLGEAETGWAVDLEGREFASIRTNRPLTRKDRPPDRRQVVELDELGQVRPRSAASGGPDQRGLGQAAVGSAGSRAGGVPVRFVLLRCRVGASPLERTAVRTLLTLLTLLMAPCHGAGGTACGIRSVSDRDLSWRCAGATEYATAIRPLGGSVEAGLREGQCRVRRHRPGSQWGCVGSRGSRRALAEQSNQVDRPLVAGPDRPRHVRRPSGASSTFAGPTCPPTTWPNGSNR